MGCFFLRRRCTLMSRWSCRVRVQTAGGRSIVSTLQVAGFFGTWLFLLVTRSRYSELRKRAS